MADGFVRACLHTVLCVVIVVCFSWSLTLDLIGWVLTTYWIAILQYAISYVANYAFVYFSAQFMAPNRTIKRLRLWMVFDFVQVAIQMVTGLTNAVLRLGLAIACLFCALPRMDRSLCPPWVDSLMRLDSIALSYDAVVIMCKLLALDA